MPTFDSNYITICNASLHSICTYVNMSYQFLVSQQWTVVLCIHLMRPPPLQLCRVPLVQRRVLDCRLLCSQREDPWPVLDHGELQPGGREGEREGGRDGGKGREGGRDGRREERRREGGIDGGRREGKEGGMEGGIIWTPRNSNKSFSSTTINLDIMPCCVIICSVHVAEMFRFLHPSLISLYFECANTVRLPPAPFIFHVRKIGYCVSAPSPRW